MTVQTMQSPLPGTFYRKPSPESDAYKNEGDTVQAGDVIGLIEVMKQFTDVEAEVSGRITKFHANDGESVDVGSPIVDIETE